MAVSSASSAVRASVSGRSMMSVYRHARACSGHPRLSSDAKSKDVDGRDIGERSDAVLRTAMPGHDDVDGSGSTAAAAAEHRLELAVGAEIVDALDRHQLGQACAGAVDAALDRTDRAAADPGRFLVGKSRRADQDEGLALIRRQLGERGAEFLELDAAGLLGLGFQSLRIGAFTVGDLATTLAIFRAEKIAQDREQPSRHIGAGLERIEVRPGAQKGFLHEVIGTI